MVAIFLFGTGLAAGNHYYYQHLCGKPVGSIAFHGFEISQEISRIIGNAFAIAVKTAFVTVIGISLVQRFWHIIHVRRLRVKEIDAVFAASSGNPFLPSSCRSWWFATTFSVLASTSMIMVLVPVIAPSALTVAQNGFAQPCKVNTSLVENANIASYYISSGDTIPGMQHLHNPQIPSLSVANRVITSGSYLPPPSPCGVCSYNVAFVGAAMNCSDVTATYNFTPALYDPTIPANDHWMGLWYGIFSYTTDISLLVAIQNGSTSAVQKTALECTAYAANYSVEVNHGTTASTVTIKSVDVYKKLNATMVPPYDPILQQLNGVAAAIGTLLAGNVTYRPYYCEYFSSTSAIAYSPILHQIDNCRYYDDNSSFQWPDMIKALPSIMENASISLLSGAYGSGEQDYLTEVATFCKVESLTYSYNSLRLLSTYAVAAIITVICISLGFYSIKDNGKEETVGFSRLMHALSNRDLTSAIDNSTNIMDERVQADRYGDIKPIWWTRKYKVIDAMKSSQ